MNSAVVVFDSKAVEYTALARKCLEYVHNPIWFRDHKMLFGENTIYHHYVADAARAPLFVLTFDETLLKLTQREPQFDLLFQLPPTLARYNEPREPLIAHQRDSHQIHPFS